MRRSTIRSTPRLLGREAGSPVSRDASVPARPPGQPERHDYEYVREGTGNHFMRVEPLAGWRHVAVTERRTKVDFAEAVRWLVEERCPDVEYVRIVLDNLNTHGPAALYEDFPAEQARTKLADLYPVKQTQPN